MLFGNISLAQVLNLSNPNGGRVELGDLDITGSSFTMEALIKSANGGGNIISKHNSPQVNNYLFRLNSIEFRTSQGFCIHIFESTYDPNKWYHVAVTYNGSEAVYYRNGCEIARKAWTGNLSSNNLKTFIGQRSPPFYDEGFIGKLDEIRLWNIARTQKQIQDNMENLPNPTQETGLLAYYKFSNSCNNSQGNPQWNGVPVGNISFDNEVVQLIKSPNPNFQIQVPSDCRATTSNGKITIRNAKDFDFSIDSIVFKPDSVFSNLRSGNYSIWLRQKGFCKATRFSVRIGKLPAQVTNQAIQICQGKSIKVGTRTYSATGNYRDTLKTKLLCDSIVVTTLTVNPTYDRSKSVKICRGDSVVEGGTSYKVSGEYVKTYQSQLGCDSTIRNIVQVIEPSSFSQTKYICSGSSFQVADTSYSTPGTFIRKTKTRYGCDSIITTTIFVGFPDTVFVDSTRCRGRVVRIGTNTFADSGNYTVVLKNKYGCDSTVNLHLTIIEPKTSSGSFTVCEGEIVKDAGREFPNEGSFETKLTALSTGCDSIRTTTISHIKIRVQTIPDSITKLQYGQALELQAMAEGTNLVYSWEPEDKVFCSTCPQTKTDSLTWNTLFTVNVRDTVFNCTASKTILAKVDCPIVVPNLVTPNGDNQNDYFRIKHLNCIDHVGSLKVFDRWGRQVYSESNLAPIPEIPLWQPAEPGIYFYQLTVNIVAGEPEQFLGWISITK
jgi:hypothetical protein